METSSTMGSSANSESFDKNFVDDAVATTTNYDTTDSFTSGATDVMTSNSHQMNRIILGLEIVLAILTTVLNILVMICTRVEKKLRGKSYMYIFSLAIADCLVGAAVMPGMIVFSIYGYWPYGRGWCTVWLTLNSSLCTVSILHLCLISNDRYMALLNPTKYMNQSKRDVVKLIVFIWALGEVAWGTFCVVFRMLDTETPDTICYAISSPDVVMAFAVVCYSLMPIFMIYVYARCVYVLCKRSSKIHVMRGSANESHIATNSIITPSKTGNINLSEMSTSTGTTRISRQPLGNAAVQMHLANTAARKAS